MTAGIPGQCPGNVTTSKIMQILRFKILFTFDNHIS